MESSEVIEALCMEGTVEPVTKEGKKLFRFKDRRRLYSADELLKLLC